MNTVSKLSFILLPVLFTMSMKVVVDKIITKLTVSQRRTKNILVFGKEILYQNGITFAKYSERKRKNLLNPTNVLVFNTIFFIRELSLILVQKEHYLLAMGDFHFRLRIHWHILMLLFIFFFGGSSLCHLWYHKKGKTDYMIRMDVKGKRENLVDKKVAFVIKTIEWNVKISSILGG